MDLLNTTFYNEKWGSSKEEQEHQLAFTNTATITKIEEITIDINYRINVQGAIYWLEKQKNLSGRELREGMF